jgi:hypothetical protein
MTLPRFYAEEDLTVGQGVLPPAPRITHCAYYGCETEPRLRLQRRAVSTPAGWRPTAATANLERFHPTTANHRQATLGRLGRRRAGFIVERWLSWAWRRSCSPTAEAWFSWQASGSTDGALKDIAVAACCQSGAIAFYLVAIATLDEGLALALERQQPASCRSARCAGLPLLSGAGPFSPSSAPRAAWMTSNANRDSWAIVRCASARVFAH